MSKLSKYIKPRDIKGDTPFDVILRAWIGHKMDELPPDIAQMLERWKQADSLLRNGAMATFVTEDGPVQRKTRFNKSKVVAWLVEYYGVSERTAYDDVQNAIRFFLTLEGRPDVEYDRILAITRGEEFIEKYDEIGDGKTVAALFKEVNKLKSLHTQTIETHDYEEFQPPKMVITSDPTELGFEKVENPDDIVKRYLSESRQSFLESEAQDAEVEE
jgi:hypothetical protein